MSQVSLVPIIDKERRNTVFNKKDIYTGAKGSTGVHVPNVDDLIYDFETGWYRCVEVDYMSCLSTLIPWNFSALSGGITNTDIIIGGMPGVGSEHYRIYVNTKVVPYEFSIDTRLRIYGTESSYIKIFKEGDISGTAISAEFNSAGALVSENIKLETVAIPQTVVSAIKTPKVGHLTEKLETGDVVSVVVYGNSGGVLSIFKLVVVNTNFVRTIDAGKKLITDITLISPYLNATDKTLLEYPANITIDSDGLMGKVTYNDGSSQIYNLASGKFALHGTDNFVTSQVGQTVPLVLSYRLAKEEYSNNVNQVGTERFISKSYRLRTVESDRMYDLKLFVVPYWDHATNTWKLDYYLCNLERNINYLVTDYVEYSNSRDAFKGDSTKWNVAQNLTVALNLDRVSNRFNPYRHVTNFVITLNQAATNPTDRGYFTIKYDDDSIVSRATIAKTVKTSNTVWKMNLANGFTSTTDWVRELYYNTDPLRYPFVESEAAFPTHVKIHIGSKWTTELPIRDVLKDFDVTGVGVSVKNGDLVRLTFMRYVHSQADILGVAAMVVNIK